MKIEDIITVAGAVAGILAVTGSLVGFVVWIIAHRVGEATEGRKSRAQEQLVQTLEAQRDAYKLERDELAGKVPMLEGKLNALRDEIGASSAIAQLRTDVAAGFERLATISAAHEDRAQRADRQQAEWNRAATRALNEMQARLHITPILEVESEPRRGAS